MNNLIKNITATQASFGITILRIVAGITFAAHGAQKLFGWFGGYGLAGVAQWMESIGLAPGYLMALAAGSAEFFGGVALIIGLLVRPAAAVLAVTMLVAIFTVHFANGFFMSNNGYEFALALLAISVALVFEGAGKLSVDGKIAR
ncbi:MULTISPECIES: DoxX family protein [Pseudomonadaceae]|jgi:putative oxidoreductase|uniref:DoxX family protein n=2 Tax=Ectopseudomonas TaxID=3236654 RepID=A0A1I5S476_9GAMM|nr:MULTISPECIES: DoxX family protein [Pseudomonas]KJU79057.1 DoxX family protein [Pseudomonas oleovorans]MBJ7547477.1 DoxX family protein [Pseudomonas sp. OA3]AQZ33884.1 DoxX family protein [Pseudomonas sp. LPH1]ERH50718.1 DoxX family protein [Pseudomonas chengduensis]KQO37703.1 DoxX family protein [Pseudomonas sp. Leaf83]